MANHMETYIHIKNGDEKVAEKLKEIFTPKEGQYQTETILLVNRLFGTSHDWDTNLSREENEQAEHTWPEYDWMQENVGAKWVYSEYEHDESPENIYLILTSAWSVPQGLLKQLAKVLSEIKSDCYITGTYEDESYDPCGAFIYAGDYDDIEDWDDEFDWEEYEEDDFYLENWREEYMGLEQDLEAAYLEYLEDKKNNPEDYE